MARNSGSFLFSGDYCPHTTRPILARALRAIRVYGEKSVSTTLQPGASPHSGTIPCIQAVADSRWKRTNKRVTYRNMKKQGELTEMKFQLKAASADLSVAKPYGDNVPYDTVVVGRRPYLVQVKSTTYFRKGAYVVNIDRLGRFYQRGDFDFLAVLVIPEDVWYIIPFSAIAGYRTLQIHSPKPNSRNRFNRFRERWDLFQ